MNVVDFIFQNVHRELIKLGYSEAIAAGGGMRQLIIIAGAHRPVKRAPCLRIVYIAGKFMPKAMYCPAKTPKRKSLAVLEHSETYLNNNHSKEIIA